MIRSIYIFIILFLVEIIGIAEIQSLSPDQKSQTFFLVNLLHTNFNLLVVFSLVIPLFVSLIYYSVHKNKSVNTYSISKAFAITFLVLIFLVILFYTLFFFIGFSGCKGSC